MGRKSNEQKEQERQKELANNPRLRFELEELTSLKRFFKYYGYSQITKASVDKIYNIMKDGKMISLHDLSIAMLEGGYSCHSLTLNALYTGLSAWNNKREKFIEPKVIKTKIETPVAINGGISIEVKEQPKVELINLTTNVVESDPIVEVRIDEPKIEESKVETKPAEEKLEEPKEIVQVQPTIEKPKKKRGRKSKAEKEAMRLAAEAEAKAKEAQKEQEISDDNQSVYWK